MDRRCLKYCLTPAERRKFDKNGYLIVEDALPKARVRSLLQATERVDVKTRKAEKIEPHQRVHTRDFLGEDQAFIDLIAYPRLLPKVWGILGWNINIFTVMATAGCRRVGRVTCRSFGGDSIRSSASSPQPAIGYSRLDVSEG